MNSSAQILIILVAVSGFLAIISLIFSVLAWRKLGMIQENIRTIFAGQGVTNLDTLLKSHSEEIVAIDKEIQELFEISNKIHNLAQRSIHKVGIVRFNPFKDIGGDQSFALALLDGKNNGIVVSSLHTREGTRIYSKPIVKGESEKYSLTDEERSAIKTATAIKNPKI